MFTSTVFVLFIKLGASSKSGLGHRIGTLIGKQRMLEERKNNEAFGNQNLRLEDDQLYA